MRKLILALALLAMAGPAALSLALAAACGDSSEKDRMHTETSTPGPLIVYTTEVRYAETAERLWPTLAVVAYDLAAQREVSRFEAGAVGEYPSEVGLAAGMVVVNFEKRVAAFALDGSGERTLFETPDRPFGIAQARASPDGSQIAVVDTGGGGAASDMSILVLDAASGRVIRTSIVPAELSAVIEWRTDASLVLGPPHGSGHYGVLHPDGTLREVVTGAYSLISPGGRYVAALPGVEGCNMSYTSHEVVVREMDSGEVVASVRDDAANLNLADWSHDGAALYYSTFAYAPDPAVPGCVQTDNASVRWYVLRLPGGTVEPTDDGFIAERNRYGERLVEYRCNGAVVISAENCQNELMRAAPVDVYVDGVSVGSGVEARVLGFVE